jgi:hypothetical protein
MISRFVFPFVIPLRNTVLLVVNMIIFSFYARMVNCTDSCVLNNYINFIISLITTVWAWIRYLCVCLSITTLFSLGCSVLMAKYERVHCFPLMKCGIFL